MRRATTNACALVATLAAGSITLLTSEVSAATPGGEVWKTTIGIPRAALKYEPKRVKAGVGEAIAFADEPLAPDGLAEAADDELTKKIAAIEAKYKPEIDEQTKVIDDKKDDTKGPITWKGKCKWEMTSAKFDVPKTSFKLRHFSYDYPRCDWKVMKIAPGIKTKFLKCGKARKEWSTKIPEFKWGTTSFSTKIPEFKWDTTEVKFHTLKCYTDEFYIGPEVPDDQKAIKNAGSRIEQLAAAADAEIKDAVADDLDSRGERIAAEIERVKLEFDLAIAEFDKTIAELSANGVDPTSMMIEVDGKQVSVSGARAALVTQRDQIVTQMSAEWKKTVDTLTVSAG